MGEYLIELHVYGLNYNDTIILLKKFNLLKDLYLKDVEINSSFLKYSANYINLHHSFEDMDTALKVFNILKNINLSKRDYSNYSFSPTLECNLKYIDKEYGIL